MNPTTENRKSEDLFMTYEVQPNGYVVNEKGKTSDVILAAIVAKLNPELLEMLEYQNAATDYDKPSDKKGRPALMAYIPGSRVIVYTVKGSNEGWFCHVDMIDKGQIKTLILFKSLEWVPDNIKNLEAASLENSRGGTMKHFRDIETEEEFTVDELRALFERLKHDKQTESETFEEYMENCSTRHNGTLERI